MDFYQIIAGKFQANIEAISISVDSMAGPIERATHLMTNALLTDRKIITCGNGPDAALAQLFTCSLLNRFENERPALPVLALSSDAATLSAIAAGSGFNELYSRQVRALGQSGDVLFCISSDEGNNNLIRAVQAAHERNMDVITLSNIGNGELNTLISSEDVEIQVDAPRRPTIIEIQTIVIHSLCELIDRSLFDSYARDE